MNKYLLYFLIVLNAAVAVMFMVLVYAEIKIDDTRFAYLCALGVLGQIGILGRLYEILRDSPKP